MFEGFDLHDADLGEISVRYRIGGTGPPVLLLHGFPQTHAIWHQVGPALAGSHTVVAPDLRGYGGSTPPRDDGADGVASYSKRAMAADQVALIERLGFDSFAVVGHDRGGRVGYRLALDHPDKVSRLAVLDIAPTAEMWRAAEKVPADQLAGWHWNTLSRPAPQPEDELNADAAGKLFPGGSPALAGAPIELHPDALADYLAALPGTGALGRRRRPVREVRHSGGLGALDHRPRRPPAARRSLHPGGVPGRPGHQPARFPGLRSGWRPARSPPGSDRVRPDSPTATSRRGTVVTAAIDNRRFRPCHPLVRSRSPPA